MSQAMPTIKCKTCNIKFKNISGRDDIVCSRSECPQKSFAPAIYSELNFNDFPKPEYEIIEEFNVPEPKQIVNDVVDITGYDWMNGEGSPVMDKDPTKPDEDFYNGHYGG